MPATLSHVRVLVVEDEMMIALDLTEAIEAAQGEVVGPARSVAEAIREIETDNIQAAILDRTLLDGKATPVAMLLAEKGIPFIFYSGSRADRLHEDFPGISVFQKPTAAEDLIKALSDIIVTPD